MGRGDLTQVIVMEDPMQDIAELVIDDLVELTCTKCGTTEQCDELKDLASDLFKKIHRLIEERRIETFQEAEF